MIIAVPFLINCVYQKHMDGEASWEEKSDYENGMYQQLMEIMGRLDKVEKEHKQEVRQLRTEISDLKQENKFLHEENQLF